MMTIGLAAGFAWFVIVFVSHFIVIWTTTPSVRARVGQAIFLFGFIGVLLSLVPLYFGQSPISKGAFAFAVLTGLLIYGALLTLYQPFYYSIVASLSLQTIILLSQQANGTLPITQLRERFASRQLVTQRLATMARNGFIVETGNGYSLTGKGRRVARFFLFFKNLWRLGPGG